ncbi:MAG: type IV toxin-antitoxin system AbiEi family antitoxin [Arachnia sp.]
MGLLNTRGEGLAQLVQQGLVRAGLKDVTVLAADPARGRQLILRHGSALYRVRVSPAGQNPKVPSEEPGWLPLLVSTGFAPATARRLADAGASFLDELGNAHLCPDGHTVLFTLAQKPENNAMPPEGTDARALAKRAPGAVTLNRASHRVAFALLANPDLAARPVRALAAAANVSIGTVHNTLAQLTEAGHLLDRTLLRSGVLLDTWADSYRRLAIHPLAPRTLYAADDQWAEKIRADTQETVLLSGLAAAAALDDQVRATDGIVYTPTLGSAVALLRLTPKPTPFRVDVQERFWGDGLPSPLPGLAPSVLIYGDLLRDGESRSLEIATTLRRNDAHLRALD